jgi:hypothetical protein
MKFERFQKSVMSLDIFLFTPGISFGYGTKPKARAVRLSIQKRRRPDRF